MKKALLFVSMLSIGIPSAFAAEAESNIATRIFSEDLAKEVLESDEVKPTSFNKDIAIGKGWLTKAGYASQGSGKQASLSIRHFGVLSEAESTYLAFKKGFPGADVKNIGRAAYRSTRPAQLCVLQGTNVITINCGTFAEPSLIGQEKLAKHVLTKLPYR